MGLRHADIPESLNRLAERVIGAAIEVHRHLGAGLGERLYEAAFLRELRERGIRAEQQVEVRVEYKGARLPPQRLDLVVDGLIVVELKAVESVSDTHLAQLVGYLRAGGFPLGLLINFNCPLVSKEVYRRVNSSALSAASASVSAIPRIASQGSPC